MWLLLVFLEAYSCQNTTDSIPASFSCTFPGQECGNVDSPISDANSAMYVCANGICICNFVYLNPTWRAKCNASYANVDGVISNTLGSVPGIVPQSVRTQQCNNLRFYRQCVADILGPCTQQIPNQPDNCSTKWQDYICSCRGASLLCGGHDGSLCFANLDPKIVPLLNSECNGVCNVISPNTNSVIKLTITIISTLLLVGGTFI